MSGFFKIWRDLFEKPIWLKSTPEQKVILITLIKMANWKDAKWEWKGRPYNCSPGEFITSYNSIINACGKGVTHQNVRTAIKRFENYEFLTYQVTVGEYGGIKITLRNWDKYQNETNTSSNSSPTVRQQFANSSLTPNKEIKKERNKEEKNCINSEKTQKKIDPFSNPLIRYFKDEYFKVFNNKPYLTAIERNKIVELCADIDDFKGTIPIVFQKLKNIDFGFENWKPTANWLLKDSNYTAVLNGTYDKQKKKTVWEELKERHNGTT